MTKICTQATTPASCEAGGIKRYVRPVTFIFMGVLVGHILLRVSECLTKSDSYKAET